MSDKIFENSKDVYIASNWYHSLEQFNSWLERERRDCVPTGPCAQNADTVNGITKLTNKYPTFKDAYLQFLKENNLEQEV